MHATVGTVAIMVDTGHRRLTRSLVTFHALGIRVVLLCQHNAGIYVWGAVCVIIGKKSLGISTIMKVVDIYRNLSGNLT